MTTRPCSTCGQDCTFIKLQLGETGYWHCGKCGTLHAGDQMVVRPEIVDKVREMFAKENAFHDVTEPKDIQESTIQLAAVRNVVRQLAEQP